MTFNVWVDSGTKQVKQKHGGNTKSQLASILLEIIYYYILRILKWMQWE